MVLGIWGNILQEMWMVVKKIAGQVQSGDFFVTKGYQKLKEDYPVLASTIVGTVDRVAYLFEKKTPLNRRNWKTDLGLEQFEYMLEINSEEESVRR